MVFMLLTAPDSELVAAEASAKHDEALTADLEELEKKTHNLELYGLTMMQLKTEALSHDAGSRG